MYVLAIICVIDILVVMAAAAFIKGFLDGVPTDGWLQKLPKLEKIVNNVAAVPSIKAYYAEKAAGNKLFAPHASIK